MSTYIVSYDLNKNKNYEKLINALKTVFDNWWHHLDSTWIVVTDKSAREVRDILEQYIDKDDELLVVGSSGEGAWKGFNSEGSQWLKGQL